MKIITFFLSVLLVVGMLIFQQNCSRVSFQNNAATGALSSEETNDTVAMEIPVPQQPETKFNSCVLPDGNSSLESGKGKIFFAVASDGIYCEKAEVRACYDGNLSGSFTKTSCGLKFKAGSQSFQSCDTPIGKIDHASTVLLFSEELGSCEAQLRSCDDGVLSGSSNFNKISCRLRSLASQGASCSLDWNGQKVTIPHNSRVIGFVSAKAAIDVGESCKLSTSRCEDGNIIGNNSVNSSCREKNIEELPEDSLLTGHVYNSAKVFVSYKISHQSQNTSCILEYQVDGNWFPVPSAGEGFNCKGIAGSVIRTTVDLSKIVSFHWTEKVLDSGAKQYSSQFRIRVNSTVKNSLKAIYCIKRANADVIGLTPELDEDCNGSF